MSCLGFFAAGSVLKLSVIKASIVGSSLSLRAFARTGA
jgi:hypothetical protein